MAEQLDIDFLLERDRHAEALLELSRRVESAETQQQAFDAALQVLCANTPYKSHWIYTFSKQADYAEFYLGGGPALQPSISRLPIAGDRMMEEIVAAQDMVIVEDAPLDPRTDKKIVAELKCRTIINVPITFDKRNLGSLGTGTFGDEGVRLPSPAERDLLKAVASHLALSLDRIRNRSEWQRAEKELQAGEARYRSLVRAMAEGVVVLDERGVITAVNPAAASMLGRQADAMVGTTSLASEALCGNGGVSIPEVELPWAITMATGAPQAGVTLATRKPDGKLVWLSINTQALDGGVAQAPYAVVTSFRDVTELRRTQQQLEMVSAALDCASDCAFMMEDDRIVQVNQGACRSLGYLEEELVGKSIFDIDPVLAPERLKQLVVDAWAQGRVAFESVHRARDGRVFPVEVEVSPFHHDGRNMGMALSRDISERKKNENALRRLNRTLLTLSAGNEALVRAGSEEELLERMCRILVEVGGHRVVWIELNRRPNDWDVFPAAVGSVDSFIDAHALRAPRGKALAEALTSGRPKLIEDVDADALSAECRADLFKAGCRSGLVLPLVASRGLIGALSIFAESMDFFDEAELELLKELADDLAYGIQSQRIHAEQEKSVLRLQRTMESTIGALADTLELRDPYTAGHQRRVALLAKAIALRIGIGPDAERAERAGAIYFAGIIHDIGKIYVPSEVLMRPGKLTPLEYSLVQTHVEAAYGILKPIEFPWPLAEIVRQHHERLDGSGYPLGLRGDEIMLEARILSVADVVEAMSAHRPYRPGLGIEAALAEIENGKNTVFDATVVDACVALFREEGFRFE